MPAVRWTPRSTPSVCTRWGCDMRPLSRRQALQLGGLGIAGIVVGSAGLAWAGTTRYDPVSGESLTAPTVLTSTTGNLTLTLEAAAGRGTLAGRDATTLRYNGSVPGPTLHLRPGDHLGIDLVNHLDQPTNLHTHGLQVSPQGNSDNPFVMVNPGQTFHYDYLIPDDHPTGTFWYHPHQHGLAADQVYGGLYGAIVIGEPDPPQVSADRVLVISDITLDGAGAVPPATMMQRMTGREGDLVLVNGQSRPQLTAQPGSQGTVADRERLRRQVSPAAPGRPGPATARHRPPARWAGPRRSKRCCSPPGTAPTSLSPPTPEPAPCKHFPTTAAPWTWEWGMGWDRDRVARRQVPPAADQRSSWSP